MEGKTAIVLGVWNKWSIAYAIAQAFVREGASCSSHIKTIAQSRRSRNWARELGAAAFFPCDVQQQSDIEKLAEALKATGSQARRVVHSLASANHEDLNQPFLNTSRDGFSLRST